MKRRARLSVGLRGSGAQHGLLTSFLRGTGLRSLWQGARRVGGPCGTGPLGNRLRRWRAEEESCQTRSGLRERSSVFLIPECFRILAHFQLSLQPRNVNTFSVWFRNGVLKGSSVLANIYDNVRPLNCNEAS